MLRYNRNGSCKKIKREDIQVKDKEEFGVGVGVGRVLGREKRVSGSRNRRFDPVQVEVQGY